MHNAADPKAVKERARAEKRQHEEAQADLRRLLAEPWGRRWMWGLLARSGVFESSFHPSGSQVYFNEGRRVIGLDLLKEIATLCPTEYVTMIEEANARHQRQERTHDRSSSPSGLDPRPGDTPESEPD
jgi:hypothetical protein